MNGARPVTRLVWDLPVRLFHWLLVVSLAGSWSTAKAGFDWRPLHMRFGYFTMGLILFRIIWGFVGPRHARFVNFLKGPAGVFHYARGLAARTRVVQSVGHNPLGALMVVLMLLLLIVQTGTGLFTSDDIVYAGPYNSAVTDAMAKRLGHWHHVNFNFILAAVCLHLFAIAVHTFAKKHPIVPAMLTGRKPSEVVPEEEAIGGSALSRACLVAALSAGMIYWLMSAAPPPGAASSFN